MMSREINEPSIKNISKVLLLSLSDYYVFSNISLVQILHELETTV